jgi:hypothetical protein
MPADHDDPFASAVGREQRELEVGGVLGFGVSFHQRAVGDRSVDRGGVGRADADDDVDRESSAVADQAGVGGDHDVRRWKAVLPVAVDRLRRIQRDTSHRSSAGVTRFRFEGSATHGGRPLQPAVPAPGFVCPRIMRVRPMWKGAGRGGLSGRTEWRAT